MSNGDLLVPVETPVATYPASTLINGALLPLPATWPINVTTNAYATSLIVHSGACRLFGLQGYDANTSGEFVQVFDLSTVPADGAIPSILISTGTAAGNFSWYGGTAGRWFQRGVVIVASSTGPTKTLAASANMWVDAQYA